MFVNFKADAVPAVFRCSHGSCACSQERIKNRVPNKTEHTYEALCEAQLMGRTVPDDGEWKHP